MDAIAELLASPAAWAALLTLIVMEVVLGIDNLIFISILSNKLPEAQRRRARRVGISLALAMRLALLTAISWIISLKTTVFSLGIQGPPDANGIPTFETDFSWKDLILLAGGLFLMWKATTEIHHSVDADAPGEGDQLLDKKKVASITFTAAIVQILLLDVVFSVDSILTAVGMTEHVQIMYVAVIVAVAVMLAAADPLANFINRNPSVVMLALGFLLMIGMVLIGEAFGAHIPKGYIYTAMAFSAAVEGLNIWARTTRARKRAAASEAPAIEPGGDRVQAAAMTVHFHEEDIPEDLFAPGASIAVDTETMGLITPRDRLCVVQLSDGSGDEHLVRFGSRSAYDSPNLRMLLADPERLKLYHYARFDLAAIRFYLGVIAGPVYCTKTASRLVRTYTDRHGLKDLARELVGVEISKQQQSSDWGGPELSEAQREYAASDVRYLHAMKEELDKRLEREGRTDLAQACFDFLPWRAELDLAGWPETDIFAHIQMSEVATRLQSQKRSWAHPGSAHDRLIRLSLIFLPVGIGVLSAFLVLAPLLTKGDVSFVLDKNKVDMATERLRLESAVYRGEDSKGQPFQLNAGSAIQKSSAEPIVQLRDLAAEIRLPEGPATLKADRGHYDLNKEQVSVDGPVKFQTADGYVLDTENATVDLKTRKMESGGAVTGKTPTGVFSANKMTADLENRTISLDGNARLRIVPKRANRRQT